MREIHVVAAIVQQGTRILAARRPAGVSRAGLWEFPGGKLEPGETPEDGLLRELQEELGLRVAVRGHYMSVTHDYPELRVHLHAYLCDPLREEIVPAEGQEIRWLEPGALDELEWSEADQPIAKCLQRGRITSD
jgi:8-oxo-dGTP diphosphatase